MSVAATDLPAVNNGPDALNIKPESPTEQVKIEPNPTATAEANCTTEPVKLEAQNGDESVKIEGMDEEERLELIRQTEFYFSDANLPYDKFMFLQTSPHLDPVKAPNMSAEAKKKAETYGPGCSPVLFQTVASFKRMRQFSSKYPTSKLVQIIQSSPTEPKLVEITTEELNGKPTFYIRRIVTLEETTRIGASDRCVYVKGFLSEDDLAKDEPKNIQFKLEQWAVQWGPLAVLRMRREKGSKGNEHGSHGKKWKNSVFIEYQAPGSAEQLVKQSKQETGKPQFNGRELTSIMFKIDYVTMKAKEKGLEVPTMTGTRKAGESISQFGSFGGNSSVFNAFKELKAIAAGTKQYAGVPPSSKSKPDGAKSKPDGEEKFIEYEGNKLSVNKDGSLKDPEELKSFRPDVALGFELQGEGRVNYSCLKKDLTIGDNVCQVVHLDPESRKKGTVGFNQSVTDVLLAEIQAKGVQNGGRPVVFTRLSDEEIKKYHLDSAILRAKSTYGFKDNNHSHKGNRGDKNGRGGGRGRGGGKGRGGGRRGNDREGGKESNGQDENNKDGVKNTIQSNKRDAEGNTVSTGGGAPSNDAVPAIGRAQKKLKTSS